MRRLERDTQVKPKTFNVKLLGMCSSVTRLTCLGVVEGVGELELYRVSEVETLIDISLAGQA